jgi:glycosyltransferase involved in cell wall biosynthesis
MEEPATNVESAKPFITVVIPTRNRADLLEDLLDSLADQTYPADRMELIVVDNSSEDDTADVVKTFSDAAKFDVRYFVTNYKTPAGSRNFGTEHAKGGIVAFIDSDCVPAPQWLARLAEGFTDDSIGLVQGRTRPNPTQQRHLFEKTINIPEEGAVYETCNIAYRKHLIEAVGGFSNEYEPFWPFGGEDMDLAWKVKRAGHASVFADKAVVYHHVFKISAWQWLVGPRSAVIWPLLVGKFPEIRAHLFGRYFLFPITAFFDLLMLGLVLAICLHPWFAWLALPYVVIRYSDTDRSKNPFFRLIRIVVCLPRAVVLMLTLLYASIRFRCIVL